MDWEGPEDGECVRGSGNVFADLGMAQADELLRLARTARTADEFRDAARRLRDRPC